MYLIRSIFTTLKKQKSTYMSKLSIRSAQLSIKAKKAESFQAEIKVSFFRT